MNITTMTREHQDLIKGQAWEGSSDDLSLITCLSDSRHVWENMKVQREQKLSDMGNYSGLDRW